VAMNKNRRNRQPCLKGKLIAALAKHSQTLRGRI